MKPALGVAATLAALAVLALPAATSASSLNLSWDRCFGDGNVYDKVFTCDTNQGTDVLVGSIEFDQALPSVRQMTATVDFRAQTPALPSWWNFAPSACRALHLGAAFAPTTTSAHCRDGWAGHAAGGIASIRTSLTSNPLSNPNQLQAILVCGVAAANAFTPQPGQETFAFELLIDHANTVGAGACAGCATPMCITFSKADIGYGTGAALQTFGLPNGSTQSWKSTVTSHGAGRSTATLVCGQIFGCAFDVICAAATPAENRTWGTIKSMYR